LLTFRAATSAVLAIALAGFAAAQSATQPATRPARASAAGAGLNIGAGLLGPARSFIITRQAADSLPLTDAYKTEVDAVLAQFEGQAKDLAAQAASIPPDQLSAQIQAIIRQERARVAVALPADQRMPFYHHLAEMVERQWVGPDGAIEKFVLQDPTITDAERQSLRQLDDTTQAAIKQMLADPDIQSSMPDIVAALQDYRNQILLVLTPAQRNNARTRLGQVAAASSDNPPNTAASSATGNTSASATAGAKTGTAGGTDSMMMSPGSATGAGRPVRLTDTGLEPLPDSAAIGQSVPNLRLVTFTGTTVNLQTLCDGHITLLEFGSYSSPAFRARVAPMKKLATTYGARVQFFVVYTREAHPVGPMQTGENKTDGILVEQPVDVAARHRVAAEARTRLNLTGAMLMDDMDNALEDALGGFPDASVIVGRDGKIVARQQWTDPSGLAELLDEALGSKATTKP
jgi:hypothetical protein